MPERALRHHPLSPGVPWPHCGKPAMKFIRVARNGDIYTCAECRHNTMHVANGRGSGTCCLRAVWSAGQLGPVRLCAAAVDPKDGKASGTRKAKLTSEQCSELVVTAAAARRKRAE